MRLDGLLVRLGSGSFLLLGLIRAPGCGDAESSLASRAADDAPREDRGGGLDGPSASFAEDAAAPMGATYQGNPLCRVTPATCTPDDDGTRSLSGEETCAVPAMDGGEPLTETTPGCRLARTSSEATPECLTATRAGTDGIACKTGQDCAPGHDCVESDSGSVCRRYCCSGTCDGHAAQSGGPTFCDVQTLVDLGERAPVCMPLKRCKLLTAGACANGETCAVVTDGGETGCVAIGQAQVGQSCDVEHCGVGLTCIGQPGARRCYALCKVSSSSCGPSLVCKTSTLFKDPAYGVCQKPTSAY